MKTSEDCGMTDCQPEQKACCCPMCEKLVEKVVCLAQENGKLKEQLCELECRLQKMCDSKPKK